MQLYARRTFFRFWEESRIVIVDAKDDDDEWQEDMEWQWECRETERKKSLERTLIIVNKNWKEEAATADEPLKEEDSKWKKH